MSAAAFYRGDGDHGALCDFILSTGTCCDRPSEYLVEWKPGPGDLDSLQVSGACVAHGTEINRGDVKVMRTHPAKSAEQVQP